MTKIMRGRGNRYSGSVAVSSEGTYTACLHITDDMYSREWSNGQRIFSTEITRHGVSVARRPAADGEQQYMGQQLQAVANIQHLGKTLISPILDTEVRWLSTIEYREKNAYSSGVWIDEVNRQKITLHTNERMTTPTNMAMTPLYQWQLPTVVATAIGEDLLTIAASWDERAFMQRDKDKRRLQWADSILETLREHHRQQTVTQELLREPASGESLDQLLHHPR